MLTVAKSVVQKTENTSFSFWCCSTSSFEVSPHIPDPAAIDLPNWVKLGFVILVNLSWLWEMYPFKLCWSNPVPGPLCSQNTDAESSVYLYHRSPLGDKQITCPDVTHTYFITINYLTFFSCFFEIKGVTLVKQLWSVRFLGGLNI